MAYKFYTPFLSKKRKNHIVIEIITETKFKSWFQKLSAAHKAQCEQQGFKGKAGETFICTNKNETVEITASTHKTPIYKDGAKIHNALQSYFSKDFLKKTSFEINHENDHLLIGFAWAAYKFDIYKQDNKNQKHVSLICPKSKKRVHSFVESVFFTRDLINTPANDMGPDELEKAAKSLCAEHEIKLSVIKDDALIKKNFPMIYTVGKASTRRPRLLDFSWGNKKHPKVTLVGKGVCFDTGGLDIKPSQYMFPMKKDMGGSAQVLGLAHLIMCLKLPIQLRVLIPAVENSIDGNAYRPSDVLNTRKGITVEVGNTDAEGRLVLADALTYASEEKPELIIDFATLTGAARIALGFDLPALFCANDKMARKIQDISAKPETDDAVWHLPLWEGYRKNMDSKIADISSTGTGRAGATNAALFLQEFVDDNCEWIHIDCHAWEESGKPHRSQGGADTAMRAIFAYLENRYN